MCYWLKMAVSCSGLFVSMWARTASGARISTTSMSRPQLSAEALGVYSCTPRRRCVRSRNLAASTCGFFRQTQRLKPSMRGTAPGTPVPTFGTLLEEQQPRCFASLGKVSFNSKRRRLTGRPSSPSPSTVLGSSPNIGGAPIHRDRALSATGCHPRHSEAVVRFRMWPRNRQGPLWRRNGRSTSVILIDQLWPGAETHQGRLWGGQRVSQRPRYQ